VSAPAPRIELRAASKRFRDGAHGSVLALAPTSLSLAPGACLRVIGPSGAGKSTLLCLASGLLLPTEGEVLLDGEPFSRWREPFRAAVRRRRMGVVLQHLALVRGMSVRENVLLAGVPDGGGGVDAGRRAGEILERLGLSRWVGAPVERLSGGEQQRVALARALCVTNAGCLVLDEPSAHLDDALVTVLRALLEERRTRDETSVLVATHDPRLDSMGPALVLGATSP
jgi:putative ABC transport system ATP-binding protein